ncbi:MAG TPA: DUF1302 family protein [Ramlibacter sp.]|nr:DUF1302 family protein [Ramlibacter sp.]
MRQKIDKPLRARAQLSLVAAAVAALLSAPAAAMQIDVGNPDGELRFDNTIRYNAGWRAEKRDQVLADSWGLQGGEYKFDKGDLITNRIDLLTELDFVYKKSFGFRVSAASWYDAAYDNKVKGNPAYQAAGFGTAYPGNVYTPAVSRYYLHSGEFLDAFVFGRVDLGTDSPLDVKLGRHTVIYGEALFSPIHGASYSQGPVDFRKALATPGVTAKELFLPLNQLSAHWQLNEALSLNAQYFLEWKPYRIYEGGTYFTYADPFFQGGTNYLGIPFSGDLTSGPDARPKDRGNWGVNAKWSPAWLNGTAGLTVRKFDDKVMGVLSPGGTFSELHNAYAKDVKLVGLSYATQVAGVSVGSELVYRKNTALNTAFGSAGLARGDSVHALANALAYIGKTPLFDSAVLLAEVTYSKLQKVNAGTGANFSHVNYNCPVGGQDAGCSTNSAWGLSLSATPTWFQVFPSVDLSMPMSYSTGLKGNSPVPFGGNKGSGSWSIGVGADVKGKYKFDLAYNDYFGSYTAGPNPFAGVPGIGAQGMAYSNGGNAIIHDRGWLSFTFKTSF